MRSQVAERRLLADADGEEISRGIAAGDEQKVTAGRARYGPDTCAQAT